MLQQNYNLVRTALRLFSVEIKVVTMPSLSPTMTHGTISAWTKQPGDLLAPGDILCEIETDKASVGFEIQDDGVLAKILVETAGPELKCGEPIALIVEDRAAFEEFKILKDVDQLAGITSSSVSTDPMLTDTSKTPSLIATENNDLSKPHRLSPAARHMVESKSLDISKVKGTSKAGLISKSDVILALKSGLATSEEKKTLPDLTTLKNQSVEEVTVWPEVLENTTAASYILSPSTEPVNDRFTDIPNSNMRKVIAKRLTESKATVPHFYTTIECRIDSLLSFRKKIKKELDVNISVNDIVIKSAALALRDLPEVNAKWNKLKNMIELSDNVDISVAVATPNGLITPIVTKASQRGIADINATVKDLAIRARDGKLKPEEYQGGSFSISNLGMFGINVFSAVINPPQACILAVGAGVSKVVPEQGTGPGSPTVLDVATVLTVQLSADRRVVDEAAAARFLQVFQSYLNDPRKLLT